METQDFDALMAFLVHDCNTKSARVQKMGDCAPLGAVHCELDGKEYMVTVVPSDLEPVT